MKNVTLIIICYNKAKKAKNIFDAIHRIKLPRGLKLSQVIVIDNGSTDNSFAVFSAHFQNTKLPVSILSYRDRLSRKRATEEALKHTKSEINVVAHSRQKLSDFKQLVTS